MPAPDMQTCTKIVHNTMLYTVHEMDTALDTALEMDTVGHELILAWVERGQPTSERGGCERGGCERGIFVTSVIRTFFHPWKYDFKLEK